VSLLLLCVLPLASSSAASLTWTGAVSSDWNNATNWTPPQVPTSTDTAIINSGTVQVASNAQFYALHLNGGTLGGSFVVRSNSVMNWNNGSLLADGSLTVESNGVLNIATGATKYCDRSLTNHGAVNWTGGVFYLRNNNAAQRGGVVNLGLWEMQGDLALEQYYNNGLEVFSNGGIFRKASGAGVGKFNAILDNQFGAIEVQSGLLSFNRSTPFANGTVHFGISSNGFGRIAVSGTATLAGRLAATLRDGFVPATNTSYQVMTFNAMSGTFTDTSGLDVGFGRSSTPVYTPTSLTLQTHATNTTSFTPVVLSEPKQELNGFSFLFTGDPGTDYTVQFSTNLSQTNWSTLLVTNIPVSPAKVTDSNATDPKRFYRVLRGIDSGP